MTQPIVYWNIASPQQSLNSNEVMNIYTPKNKFNNT